MGFVERFLRSSARDLNSPRLYRAVLAEMLGTMLLVLLATMSVVSVRDVVGISLAIGLALASLVWTLADVSGGHINPAVSAAMLATRKISLVRFLLYVPAQCIGGIIGTLAMQYLTCSWQATAKGYGGCTLGVTELGRGVSVMQGFAAETLITLLLLLVACAATDASRDDLSGCGPLAIGLSVTVCHLAVIPLTGASMNPAGTLGPAVVSGHWEHHWVYWAGPVIGGVMGALLYDLVLAGDASLQKFGDWLIKVDYCRPSQREALPAIVDEKKFLMYEHGSGSRQSSRS